MLLNIFGFLNFSFADIIDILMVAVLIYIVFKWMKGSVARNIFLVIIVFFLARVIVAALNMKLMNAILSTFTDIGVIALIVIFQPEVRHFMTKFSNGNKISGKGKSLINRLFGIKEKVLASDAVNELAEACRQMGAEKTGALIVLPKKDSLEYVISTGDVVDALVSRRLIMNIFFKNSPLHDGAMIIDNDRIVAARCTLPITSRTDIAPSYGMRHKAAIGISEETDCNVVVVSEETGHISFVHSGILSTIENINELKLLLSKKDEEDQEARA